jgi:hypothetical protein
MILPARRGELRRHHLARAETSTLAQAALLARKARSALDRSPGPALK